MNITEVAVKRPIATTMVFLIIIVVGIMGLRFLPVDLLPPIDFPRLSIMTGYPNVGPEEIETIITDRVENAIASVPNTLIPATRPSVSMSCPRNSKYCPKWNCKAAPVMNSMTAANTWKNRRV